MVKKRHQDDTYNRFRTGIILTGCLLSLGLAAFSYPAYPEASLVFGFTLVLAATYYFILPVPLGASVIAYSFDFPLSLAMLLLCGPFATGLARGATCWLSALQLGRARMSRTFVTHAAFNATVNILAMAAAGFGYRLLGGEYWYLSRLNGDAASWHPSIFAALAAGMLGIISQGAIINTSVTLRERRRWSEGWVENIGWTLVPNLLLIPSGLLLAYLCARHLWWIGLSYFILLFSLRAYIKMKNETIRAYLDTVTMLGTAMHKFHAYTANHQLSVAAWAERIGRHMQIPADTLLFLRYGSLLHDIGKLRWGEDLLDKKAPLTPADRAMIFAHAADSADILSRMAYFKRAVPWVRYHHERWDGQGYPDGLKGAEIPLPAAIMCAADSYHAMLSRHREYKKHLTREEAVVEIRRMSGAQFHPRVAAALIEILTQHDPERAARKQAVSLAVENAGEATLNANTETSLASCSTGGDKGSR
ncbi:MAG: HD domain-containing protein [Armatimonadetes bacterium]|nr:HD domain-containing protein [Armatimonadota bacterium]